MRVDVGTILTGTGDDKFLVVDVFPSGKIALCRIPDGMEAKEYGRSFHHDPLPDDPTHVTLTQ